MLALLLAILPPVVAVGVRRLRGARIARDARIDWLALVDVADLEMGSAARIASLSIVRAKKLTMGRAAHIRSLSIVSTHTVWLGEAVHIAPTAIILASLQSRRAKFVAGDHSRIFPFCWIEPGEGIELGRQVGIGGHGLIFTHGSWMDYLEGGPIVYAPVSIEDGVWLPWRVTVQAGVTIGAGTIVMSGSVVTKSLPPNVIAGGSPARLIRERDTSDRSPEAARNRASEIIAAFEQWYGEARGEDLESRITIDEPDHLSAGDVLFVVGSHIESEERRNLQSLGVAIVDHPNHTYYDSGIGPGRDFADFLQRYGIRLYRR